MGQATLDLPDPTQLSGVDAGPLSPEALASADDLLSQLAGDDIDRLLAEAEAEKPPVAAPSAVAPSSTSDVPPIVAAATIVEPIAAVDATTEAATEAAIDAILSPAIDSSMKIVDQELAAVAAPAEITAAVEPAAAPEISPATPPAVTPIAVLDEKLTEEAAAHVAAIMDVPVAAPEPVFESPTAIADAAERQALAEPLVIPPTHATTAGRVSLLVKILQWINSPMMWLSDEVRDALGKVALLTMFNAIAVIIYVMVFRRPHHGIF